MENKRKIVFTITIFQTVMGALIGLICGVLYSFGGLVIDALVSAGLLSPAAMGTPGLSYGTLLAFGALIGMPIIFTIAGLVLGVVEAILYLVFASWFRRLKVDFVQ